MAFSALPSCPRAPVRIRNRAILMALSASLSSSLILTGVLFPRFSPSNPLNLGHEKTRYFTSSTPSPHSHCLESARPRRPSQAFSPMQPVRARITVELITRGIPVYSLGLSLCGLLQISYSVSPPSFDVLLNLPCDC